MTSILNNILFGRPQTSPSAPSHVRGIHEGNAKGNMRRQKGILLENGGARGTAERSTGINADARNPIDPSMPNLSPS